MKRKWFWPAAITLMLAVILATVGLAVAGGSDDPLVALSYLTGTYKKTLMSDARTEISTQITETKRSIDTQLNAINAASGPSASSSSTGYWRVSLTSGQRMQFETGTEILILSGSAVIEEGSLSDSTAGSLLGSPSAITLNHLNVGITSGTLRMTSAAEILVRD